MKRREFIARGSVISFGMAGSTSCQSDPSINSQSRPIVISTWDFGVRANEVAWEIIEKGGRALDAVEQGVRLIESDPDEQSVGYGGLPDREGHVTLDACLMDENSNCGSVAFLRDFKNPISIARRVMEQTSHVMLVGAGAKKFALEEGFTAENLLTEKSKQDWKDWLQKAEDLPVINIENHDTISMLAIDQSGNISGACTTSGLAYKMHGRVGDSPIIGAGLFLDNGVGGACATGLGEAVIRTAGSAMVVEAMRYGASPQEACKTIVGRIREKHNSIKDFQVGFIAIDKNGNYGAYAVQEGFTYAVCTSSGNELFDSKSIF
jgi:N4-(beta-N-acetylglucosaminyl)-L-asparaginase